MLFTALASQTCFDESGRSSPPARRSATALPRQPAGTVYWPTMCWPLGAGEAVTFRAPRRGQLRATGGPVWLTYSNNGRIDAAGVVDTTRDHPARITGDFALAPGEDFALTAGETVVLQAWSATARITLQWHPGGACSEVATSTSRHWTVRLTTLARTLLHQFTAGPAGLSTEPRQAGFARPFEAATSDPSAQLRLY